jgi:hypothetical protein
MTQPKQTSKGLPWFGKAEREFLSIVPVTRPAHPSLFFG